MNKLFPGQGYSIDIGSFWYGDTEKEDQDDLSFEAFGPLKDMLTCECRTILLEGPSGTGKSRASVEYAHLLADNIDGVRIAFVRKKRVDATESILQVYEDWVVPQGHPVLKGPQRAYRKVYNYPNGSSIHVFGLSDRSGDAKSGAEKLKSTAWDFVIFEEATEMTQSDYLLTLTRMRSAVIKKPKILMPFNPTVEQHWIYSLVGKPDCMHYHTVHHDNPRYWRKKEGGKVIHPVTKEEGEWTEKGLDYIENNLALLPEGPMRDRFFLGEKVKPTGIVFPEFDTSRNTTLEPFYEMMWKLFKTAREIERHIQENYFIRVSIDFGSVHPLVIQCWLRHKITNKSIMVKEYYRSGSITDTAATAFINYFGWSYSDEEGGQRIEDEEIEFGFYLPLYDEDGTPLFDIVSDHDTESRDLVLRATGVLPELAFKSRKLGIETTKKVLRDGDIVFDVVEAIGGDDINQKKEFKPTSTVGEVLLYLVNPKTGDPIPLNDDGWCATRYYVCSVYEITDIKMLAKDVTNSNASNARNFDVSKSKKDSQPISYGQEDYVSYDEGDSIYGRKLWSD